MEISRAPKQRPLTRVVGENLAYWRKERGLSLAELSARMGDAGLPLNLNGLNKIERGNRGVDLDELVALARVLDLPPLLLIFPVGSPSTIELLPGVHVPPWLAARWFTGEAGFPIPGPEGGWDVVGEDQYTWINAVTHDFRIQEEAVENWRRARQSGDSREETAWSRSLQLTRQRIRDRGMDPGELAADVAHLDAVPDGQR